MFKIKYARDVRSLGELKCLNRKYFGRIIKRLLKIGWKNLNVDHIKIKRDLILRLQNSSRLTFV